MNERRTEHDMLRQSMARYAAIMDKAGGPDHTLLIHERVVFSRLFASHLLREQEEVAAVGQADPKFRGQIRHRSESLAGLRADYSAHVNRWTPTSIRADFGEYRARVLVLQKRLTSFMLWEEANLPIYA